MIHFLYEGSFLYYSTFGRQVNLSEGPLAEMCAYYYHSFFPPETHVPGVLGKEYAKADFRWGFSEPTVVSLEILTVLGAGPLCCYILKQLVSSDPARHYWIVVLSTAELYGGCAAYESFPLSQKHSHEP